MNDYNAYGGNAYGLANTLKQTAVLKPSLKNKKVSNLFLYSATNRSRSRCSASFNIGQIAAKELIKQLSTKKQ